jgi:hypothetical protein
MSAAVFTPHRKKGKNGKKDMGILLIPSVIHNGKFGKHNENFKSFITRT